MNALHKDTHMFLFARNPTNMCTHTHTHTPVVLMKATMMRQWALAMVVAAAHDTTTREWGGGGSRDQKMVIRVIQFVGSGEFVLSLWHGMNFSFYHLCLHSKSSDFYGEFKNGWKQFKPANQSGSDLG